MATVECPISASLEAGKLVGYEIYQAGGTLVESVRFEKPISNYMNPVLLQRLANISTSAGPIYNNFLFSQLGTGTSANPRMDESLETPVLSRVDWNNHAVDTGTQTGGFKKTDVNYTYTFCRQIPAIDPDTGESYNTVRTRWRISHRHAMVPSTQATPLVIAEIGWSDTNTNTMSSRIVLPPNKRITLGADQFLVTIYEIEGILPDMKVRPFSNIPIAGAFQWANLSTYQLEQVVTYKGVNYKSLISGNKGNVPTSSPDAWEEDTTTQLAISGIYVFRGAYPKHSAPIASLLPIHAWNCLLRMKGEGSNGMIEIESGRAIDDSNYFGTIIISRKSQFLPEGNGAGDRSWDSNQVLRSLDADTSQSNVGKVTVTASNARDSGVTMDNVRSIFIFGYQFLLDVPICRASDQSISITATLRWNLVQSMD